MADIGQKVDCLPIGTLAYMQTIEERLGVLSTIGDAIEGHEKKEKGEQGEKKKGERQIMLVQ